VCLWLTGYIRLNRALQNSTHLEKLLDGVTRARNELMLSASTSQSRVQKPKLVLKIAPDLSEEEVTDIAAAIRHSAVDGVIVSNTTVRRPSGLTERTCFS